MRDERWEAKSGDAPAAPLVRAELDRILASELFARSDRLSSFLRFIVERTLAGDGESLKEQVIAVELYGKAPDFEAAADPIVRVDARRLRDKLREYYAAVKDPPLVISVPKGGYTPLFIPADTSTLRDADSVAAATSGPPSWVPTVVRRWPIAAAIVLVAGVTGLVRSRVDRWPEPRQIAVTSLVGFEEDPALSPDGRFVAFAHSGSDDDVHNIWIMPAAGGDPVNLTKTPDMNEEWPRWSPDGQWITFSRKLKDGSAVFKVSPLGGVAVPIANDGLDASWTPNGALVMEEAAPTPERLNALVYLNPQTGRRRKLTDAPRGFEDRHPRVSPNGQILAFVRGGEGRSAIYRMPLNEGTSERTPEIVGEWATGMPTGGLEWMPDGRELLAAKWTGATRRLVRIPLDAGRPEVSVPGIPSEVAGFSLSPLGVGPGPPYRLAVSIGQPKIGLRFVDLAAPRSPASAASDSPFWDSTRVDFPGRFSPDGVRVAFVSNRGGSFQVWVANRDGSPPQQVTHLEDAMVGLGSWSPDGRLAFDATIGNRTDIYVVGSGGGPVKRLTQGSESATDPEWSRDGRWIYFSSTRSGSAAIWRMPAEGGSATRLTFEAGFDLRESPDGSAIYFIARPRAFSVNLATPLKRMPAGGGPSEDVGIRVAYGAWEVTDSGIVFVAEESEGLQNSRGGKNVLRQYDFADRQVHTIARLGFIIGPYGVPRFLAVSRDGRWALANHVDHWERDVVVLDNFR